MNARLLVFLQLAYDKLNCTFRMERQAEEFNIVVENGCNKSLSKCVSQGNISKSNCLKKVYQKFTNTP